jgi:hypothetical protein
MSTWNQFKDLSVRVCRNQNQEPFQWIYAVDDAWLHPCGFVRSGNIKKPVFEQLGCLALKDWTKRWRTIVEPEPVDVKKNGQYSTEGAAPGEENIGDANVANILIEFALEGKYRAALPTNAEVDPGANPHFGEYGVCFCSFEYFWEHFKEINQPFNAVIFDLNHALRDSGNLATDWKGRLEKTSLFGDANINLKNLHGWMLHFAAKLGRIGDQRCLIDANHILILSSNLMGAREKDGTDSMQAFQQYATIQRDLWEHISSGPALLADNRIIDFSFCPLPKNIDGVEKKARLLDKGLEVFDRTFQKMGCWSTMRKLFEEDLGWARRYAKKDGVTHFDAEHEMRSKMELRWTGWIDPASWITDLKGAYNEGDRSPAPTLDLFVRILKSSCIRGTQELDAPQEQKQWPLKFPAKPEIEVVARILDLLDALTPSPGEKIIRDDPNSQERKHPVLNLEVKEDYLILKITIPQPGIAALQDGIAKSKKDGASPIARELQAQALLEIPPSEDFILIKIAFQNI